MTILNLTGGILSKTAPYASSGVAVDNTVVVPPTDGLASWTLKIQVSNFTAGETARISIEDSVDNFGSDILAGPTEGIQGGLSETSDLVLSWTSYDFPDFRIGIASAKIRVNLTNITGGTIKYTAWLEY